jgi:hypothetical protein
MTVTTGSNVHVPDPAQVKCAEILDKLLALSACGASGELPLAAAAQLAAELAGDLALADEQVRALHASR